ncbi:MAG: hercynine oxygenase [Phycisphaerae bacterium]
MSALDLTDCDSGRLNGHAHRPRSGHAERYCQVRAMTERLARPLTPEDCCIQSTDDVSPTKWHLAHTSWFFETFVLAKACPDYQPFHPAFAYLYNSYYLSAGERHCRPRRGLISRPSLEEVYAYRRHVDERMSALLEDQDQAALTAAESVVELGLNHEQQHQELMLTDIKHVFWSNPLRPAYCSRSDPAEEAAPLMRWHAFSEGLVWIGSDAETFAYDNERPRHRVLLNRFEMASRLVTNGEYIRFIEDGGYRTGTLWLSDGWNTVQTEGWEAPLYWEQRDGVWWYHTLAGMRPVNTREPVCHVSLYEADAYARWAGARLPTEAEWEAAAAGVAVKGNFVESERFHPAPVIPDSGGPLQMFGDVWTWTGSAYLGYPGYRPPSGALGEYNGKFMCNQFVLRGGSCATPSGHVRRTYRNFFPPAARWQFTGLRLARDA